MADIAYFNAQAEPLYVLEICPVKLERNLLVVIEPAARPSEELRARQVEKLAANLLLVLVVDVLKGIQLVVLAAEV